MRAPPSCQIEYQELGFLGKKILKKILGKIPRRPAASAIALCVVLTACHEDIADRLQSGRVLAWDGMEGRWVGSVVPTETDCGPATHGVLSAGEHDFGFDPFQSTTVIHGEIARDGHLSGILVRQGGEHQPISISFDAAPAGSEAINGTLQSGHCHWTVALHRG